MVAQHQQQLRQVENTEMMKTEMKTKTKMKMNVEMHFVPSQKHCVACQILATPAAIYYNMNNPGISKKYTTTNEVLAPQIFQCFPSLQSGRAVQAKL